MGGGIEVRGLRVDFGPVKAVEGITFTAPSGEVSAVLGRNGAGKSTTMRVLAGVIPPTSGTVMVAGHDVADDPVAVKYDVGYCPDIGGLVPRATPWEHLELQARLRRLRNWESRARELLERFDLAGEAHRVTSGFSHGMSRRLSVLLAAMSSPKVLLLDEPFDGVDPLGVEAALDSINEARAAGACVLISTHLRELATRVADSVLVLRGGAQVAKLPAAGIAGYAGEQAYRELLAQ